MKKHPLSTACAYTMLGALIVFGLAGLSLEYPDMLPADLRALFAANAKTAILGSLGAAFLAASLASMRAAWHTERAYQAGEGHRRIFWAALVYTGACIVIEVIIGKLGAHYVGQDVNPLALIALCSFFAIAPRLVSFILAGMDGIEKEELAARQAVEHSQDIERIHAVAEQSRARIEAGVVDLDKSRRPSGVVKAAGAIGAAAALLGVAGAAMPSEAAEFPTVETAPASATTLEEEFRVERVSGDGVWVKGPRADNREKFQEALNLIQATPKILPQHLAAALDIDPKTAKQWIGWAQVLLSHAPNADLIEVA